MRHHAVGTLILIVLAAMVAACATKPPVAVPPVLFPQEDLLLKLRNRADSWEGYQAKVNVKGEGAKKAFSVQAFIVADLPHRLRFEAHKLGQTAGVLIFDENRSSLWVPSEQVVYTSASGERLIEHFLGASIPPEAFTRSLIAIMSKEQSNRIQVLPDESNLLLHVKEPKDDMAFTWKLASKSLAIESILVREGSRAYTVTYDPPVDIDPGIVPRKVVFESDQWRLEVKIDQLVPSRDPSASAFALKIPEGTRSIDLATLN